ncbi:hypothetical protein NC651_031046 [Populus alba x Populus x berolinensis]|nr:hypothetical protein NC651_031046 [Populus alba x Populus x berolinensis]
MRIRKVLSSSSGEYYIECRAVLCTGCHRNHYHNHRENDNNHLHAWNPMKLIWCNHVGIVTTFNANPISHSAI